jgi:methionine-rich copper-binding protein CopC
LLTSVVSAPPASAHARLVKITPEQDAQLSTAPKQVVLEFTDPVSSSFATVVVTNAAAVMVTAGKPRVVGTEVTQALSPGLAAGHYRVAFRVVSADGHPVTGESGFTVTVPSRTSPATSIPSAPATSPPPAGGGVTPSQRPVASRTGGLSMPAMAIAAALGLTFLGAGVLLRRRRGP